MRPLRAKHREAKDKLVPCLEAPTSVMVQRPGDAECTGRIVHLRPCVRQGGSSEGKRRGNLLGIRAFLQEVRESVREATTPMRDDNFDARLKEALTARLQVFVDASNDPKETKPFLRVTERTK